MKTIKTALFAAGCLGIAACDVDQTKEGDLPDVDVNVSGGELPEFNVQGPSVEVGSANATVEVPEVKVDTKKADVKVPTLDVDLPKDDNR